MKHFKLMLALFVVLWTLVAEPAAPSGDRSLIIKSRFKTSLTNACERMLSDFVREELEGKEVVLVVDGLSNLGGALIGAGLSSAMADRLIARLQNGIFHGGDNPLFLRVRRALRDRASDPNSLLVCVVSGVCAFRDPLVTAQFSSGAYELNPMADFLRDGQSPSLIFMAPMSPPLKSLRPDDLLETLSTAIFHQLVHYADSLLLLDWISANLSLAARGQNTDPVYQRFYLGDDLERSKFRAFIKIFSEGRARQGSLAFQEAGIQSPRSASLWSYAKGNALRALRDEGPSVERLLTSLQISSANVFERGLAWGATMEQTIARAKEYL